MRQPKAQSASRPQQFGSSHQPAILLHLCEMDTKLHFSSSGRPWGTPQHLVDCLHAQYDFPVDVCATVDNAKLPSFFRRSKTAWCRAGGTSAAG
ncbi:MAG: hypothetical protein EOO40_10450 [Deltaproteobacteria bacterium]|nr:MAG: hypothetical protein EOO40_10450 [Deltaproteobacteria bacterium]